MSLFPDDNSKKTVRLSLISNRDDGQDDTEGSLVGRLTEDDIQSRLSYSSAYSMIKLDNSASLTCLLLLNTMV